MPVRAVAEATTIASGDPWAIWSLYWVLEGIAADTERVSQITNFLFFLKKFSLPKEDREILLRRVEAHKNKLCRDDVDTSVYNAICAYLSKEQ